MNKQCGPVWVIAEQIDCRILPVSLQLIGQARKLATELNTSVETVMLGDQMDKRVQQLFAAGADRVYLGNTPELAFYQPEMYTEIIIKLVKEHQPEILLVGSTSMGTELAPLVAARLGTGLTAHCIDLIIDDNKILEQRIPAYGGLISIICPEKRPQMATIASGVFPHPELDENRTGEIIHLEIPHETPHRVQTLKIVREESGLNAALGSTRPAVDEGWTELETMIGQSGKMVSPELYIGVGLSGELQHMVGIVGAKVMVAINNDVKAPVFEQVDYGIVDDCREFVPMLIEKIKEHQERKITC